MSTRSLTCYKKDGEIKIAKYTQCDGYPGGLGSDICSKLKTLGLDLIESNLWKAQFLTEYEVDNINDNGDWKYYYPYLSGDVGGAEILDYLIKAESYIKFLNSENFAADSLFCEWTYVIDFDTRTFQIYKGFNKIPLTPDDMFYHLQKDDKEYKPVKFVSSFSFDQLPDGFSTDCDDDGVYTILPHYNELEVIKTPELVVVKKDGLWCATYTTSDEDVNVSFWNKNRYKALEALTKRLLENI